MLELIEKNFQWGNILPLEQIRSVFECKITIPDDLPGVRTVLTVNGIAKVSDIQEAGQSPEVNLEHTLIYLSDTEESLIMSYNFTSHHTLDLNFTEASESDKLILAAFIEHTDFTLDDNRNLTLRCVVRAEPRVYNCRENKIVIDIQGADDLQLKKNILPITNMELLPEVITEIKEDLVLPAGKKTIERILCNDIHISDVTMATEDGLAVIKGTIFLCTLYLDSEGEKLPSVWENRIPFTTNLILPALDAQLVSKNCKITEFTAEIKEDDDGECRIMAVSVLLSVSAVCSRYEEISAVTDAFSLNKKLSLTSESAKISQLISNISNQFVLKDIAEKPEDAPPIGEIINISGSVGHFETEVLDGKISMDGFISCKVLYLTGNPDKPVSAFNIEIPFTQTQNEPHAEKDSEATLEAQVSHISYCIISPEEIELRLALQVSGTLTKTCEHFVLSGAVEQPGESNTILERPSILIYIVQPGDTLWEIAKHYSSSPAVLQTLNNLKTPDNLTPGQKLIIA